MVVSAEAEGDGNMGEMIGSGGDNDQRNLNLILFKTWDNDEIGDDFFVYAHLAVVLEYKAEPWSVFLWLL